MSINPHVETLPAWISAGVRQVVPMAELPDIFGKAFGEVAEAVGRCGAAVVGPAYGRYFGMPGETVDGNDVEAVRDVVGRAVERARKGEGPTFIEALTYRWRGHSKSDKNLYRTKEEIAAWRDRDPIAAFAHVLLERGVGQEALDAVQAGVRQEIRDAVVFGTKGPEPTLEDMLAGVYATEDPTREGAHA